MMQGEPPNPPPAAPPRPIEADPRYRNEQLTQQLSGAQRINRKLLGLITKLLHDRDSKDYDVTEIAAMANEYWQEVGGE